MSSQPISPTNPQKDANDTAFLASVAPYTAAGSARAKSAPPKDAVVVPQPEATNDPYAEIPEELKELPNWVNYISVPKLDKQGNPVLKPNGKPKTDKIPYNPKFPAAQQRKAKPNDPNTWGTFEQAVANATGFSGIGFMFGASKETKSGFAGFDADNCVDADTQIAPWAAGVLTDVNSYAEYSQSGDGVHGVFRGKLPGDGTKAGSAEMYDCGRFFAFTGKRIEDYPADIRAYDCAALYARIKAHEFDFNTATKKNSTTPQHSSGVIYTPDNLTAEQKIELLMRGEIISAGQPFEARYGDHTVTSESQSETDMSLANLLMRKHKGDVDKVDAEFQTSILKREEWDRKKKYTLSTAAKSYALKKNAEQQPFAGHVKNPPKTAPAPEAILIRGDQVSSKKVKWMWPERVPLGKVTLYAGNPDNGKSLAGCWLAATTTMGTAFPDAPNPLPPSEVLMLLGEDDLDDTAVPRVKAAGGNRARVIFWEGVTVDVNHRPVCLDKHMETLEQILKENPNIRLLIIDPITDFLGGANMMGDQEARSGVLRPLKNIAAKYNIAIVLVMHLNKKSELEAINRVGGAMAFIGVARAGWLFQRDRDDDGKVLDTFSMTPMKHNLTRCDIEGLAYKVSAAEQTFDSGETGWVPYVVWTGTTTKSADEALGGGRPAHRPEGTNTKLQTATQFLVEALKDGRQPFQDLVRDADLHGISKRTLQNAADELKVKRTKDNGNGVGYWELRPVRGTAKDLADDSQSEISLE